MKFYLRIVNRLHFALEAASCFMAQKWQRKFYLYLAALFTLFALADALFLQLAGEGMSNATFDPMVRYRLFSPKPDKDIVIVDIDEASLASMSKQYGRWPWPRQVLGEFLDQVEKQHPQAVIFDILFSDPDVFNPASDARFDASIARTSNTYFPMLLLGGADENVRQTKVEQIPGITPIPGEAQQLDAMVNVVLPSFKSALESGRVGTQNVLLDGDGVVRNYPVYSEGFGWQFPSLPARLGRDLGWSAPATDHMLLNWRGGPHSYRYVSFAEAFNKMRKSPGTLTSEFKDKIVIIGSTAPNLFDASATPMSEMYPSVELLATAIDNYKHGDSLRYPEGRLWYLLVTLAILWFTAYAFYRENGRDKVDRLFSLSQFILVGFTFACINFTNTYINLAGPVMIGIAYFSLARLYAALTDSVLEQNIVRLSSQQAGDQQATLLLLQFDGQRNAISERMLSRLRGVLRNVGSLPKGLDVMPAAPGVWGGCENTLAIAWVANADDAETRRAVENEITEMRQALAQVLHQYVQHPEGAVSWRLHQGAVQGGASAADAWRSMLAQALLQPAQSL